MSKAPKDPHGKVPRGGNAGKAPAGRKHGYGSGRASKAPPKQAKGDKPDGRDK